MINPEKIRDRLLKECPHGARTGRVQEIAKDLGISPVVVTQHKQGSKPISKYALAMYHYYFRCIDNGIVDSEEDAIKKIAKAIDEYANEKNNSRLDDVMPAVCVGCITAEYRNEWIEPCHSCHNGSNKQTEA